MNTSILLVLALLLSSAAFAQPSPSGVEVITRYVRIDPQGTTRFDSPPSSFTNRAGNGFGAEVNVYVLPAVSLAFGASQANAKASFDLGDGAGTIALGSLGLRPITAAAQWHFGNRGAFDVYVGGGAMYLMAGSLRGDEISALGVDRIDFDNKLAPMANGGVLFRVTPSIAIDLDAKYAAVKATSHARFDGAGDAGDGVEIRLNPFVYSAGVRFRF